MRYRVHAVAETPLAISVRRAAGNDLNTLTYLPGTVLRGALASAYLQEHDGTADEGFEALFLKGRVRYGDLRVGDARPWPLSTRQCSVSADDHPKVDLLLNQAAGQTGAPECLCGAKMEPPRGFYRFKRPDETHDFGYHSERVDTHRQAHSEIDPRFLKTRPGQFHSAQLIDRAQTFEGFIQADGIGGEKLKELVGEGREIYVGRGRSRGQGRVQISLYPDEARTENRLLEKLQALNRKAARYDTLRNKVVFTCSLDSHTIVYDRWLLARSFLNATDFGAELNSGGDYELLACFRGVTELPGWHAKGGLPKGDSPMIVAGSCFLFGREGTSNRAAEYERLAGLFAALERKGIGERLDEGFGEITFCRTLHSKLGGAE